MEATPNVFFLLKSRSAFRCKLRGKRFPEEEVTEGEKKGLVRLAVFNKGRAFPKLSANAELIICWSSVGELKWQFYGPRCEEVFENNDDQKKIFLLINSQPFCS